MERFPWNPALETGHEDIDSQHRSLFRLAGELADAVDDCDCSDDVVADALYALSDYCVQHLCDEESLMESSGYPELPAHKSLHQALTSHTIQLMARYFDGEDMRPSGVAPFVVEWLTLHIEMADRRFVEYLRHQ